MARSPPRRNPPNGTTYYAGLTGAVDESGAQRREQGLARAGNARICRGINQLAWRFLMFHEVATT